MKPILIALLVVFGALSFAANITPVDVNSATEAQLEAIPGIGPKLAADILKARPFKDEADFQSRVKGISNKNLKKMEPYLQFGAAATATNTASATNSTSSKATTGKNAATCTAPVNVNKASAQEINAIPGIGDKIAAEIVQNRPYKDENDLVVKIKGIGPKNIVKFRPCFSY